MKRGKDNALGLGARERKRETVMKLQACVCRLW